MDYTQLQVYLNKLKLMNFSELQKEVHNTAKEKGFWDNPRNNGELIALIHSELSECLEELRKTNPEMNHVSEELADAVIRIMDMAEGLGLRLNKSIIEKMAVNKSRSHKHGKRF